MTDETNAPSAGADAGASALDNAEQANAETKVAETAAEQETAEKDGEEDSEEDQPRRKSGSARLRERLDREIEQRARMEERLRFYEEQARANTPQQQAQNQPPREEDFNGDYLAFIEARAAHTARMAMQAELDSVRNLTQAERQAAAAREAAERFEQSEKEFRKSIPDYDEVVSDAIEDGLRLPPHLTEAIAASDVGPALVYRLAKNPKEAARIINMPPLLAARELGRIEASISQIKPRTESKAPPPFKPVSGKSSPIPAIGSSMKDYERWRNS